MDKSLNLSFPDLLEGQEFLTETDHYQLQRLLNNDSSSDLEQEIRRFTEIVFDLNRCPQSLSEKEANLKLLHAKYSSLSNALRDYSQDSVNKSSELDKLMHDLTREMSFAFKSFLYQLEKQGKWGFRLSKKAAFAVNYSIHYLSLLKAEFYIAGEALPAYLWRELHQLFKFSEVKKLTKTKLKDVADNCIFVADTIPKSYARACLAATMNPYGLSREEVWNLFHYIGLAVDDVTISNDPSILKGSYCLEVDLAQGQRPKQIREQFKHQSSQRYLNIDSFSQLIKSQLTAFASNKELKFKFLSITRKSLHEKLLQLMYRYSVQYVARGSDRYPIEVEAQVVWGLKRIVKLLQSEVDMSVHTATTEFMKTTASGETEFPLVWQTVNESKGGLCIQEQQHRNLSIPESLPLVISKQLPDQQGRWQLAVTRWHTSEGSTNKLGIQYVKGSMQLAKLANRDSEYLVCIGPDKRGHHFLLTSKGALQGLKNLVIEIAHDKFLVNHSGMFPCVDSDLVQVKIVKKPL